MVDIGFRITAGHVPNIIANTPATLNAIVDLQNRAMREIREAGQKYPPPTGRLPKQAQLGRKGKIVMRKPHQYVRTFTLKNSWHIVPAHISGDTIRGAVYNNATDPRGRHYPSYVYGSTEFDQAPIHQGRWPERTDLFDRRAYNQELRAIVNGG